MPTYPTYKLGDIIADAIGGDWGKDPSIQDESYELAYCIRGAEYKNWAENNGSTAVLRKIKCTNLQKRQLKEGDIIVEISGGGPEQPVGRTEVITKKVLSNFNGSKVLCTNFLRLIRPNLELVDAFFLNYYLKFFYSTGEIIKYQAGSNNLRNLKFKDYLNLPIPLPPLPTQHLIVTRIETLFAELDKGVEKLKTAQQQLKVYRQAVLNDCLTKGSEKWKNVKLGDVAEIVTGNTPSKKDMSLYGNDYPFFKPTDLNAGINTIQAEDNVSIKGFNMSRKLPIGSILVTCIGATIGKTGLIHREGICNQQINAVLPNNSFVPKYMYYFVISDFFQRQIKTNASATTLPILNKSKFSNLYVFLPSLPEQQRIVQEIETRLSACDEVEKNIAESLQQSEALRQSILKKAFSGELVR